MRNTRLSRGLREKIPKILGLAATFLSLERVERLLNNYLKLIIFS